ncbi:uncharacterized protein LOC115887466 isoform X8 [Sitophilus oryzae]|uniref:Uncharacterized protein LOC115887466 isoform X8 n=1 Tax=Sitophilus oryzae TaxID=7048 RepID=A0A6J2YH67_SITOR|nr:uncharacterized protein LOC115887466 isoform X8 [Sitophilus oryzae]
MTERCELSDNDEAAKQSTTSLQINNWCENEDNSTLDNTKQGTEEANDIEYCLELIPNLNDDAHSLIIEGTSQTKHENRIENLAANNVGAIHIGDRIYVNGDAEFTGNIGGSIYQKRLRESLENRSDCTKKVVFNWISQEQFKNLPIIPRNKWSILPPANLTTFPEFPNIFLVKHTGGKSCHSLRECFKRLRDIQMEDINENNMADIRYNFLIGQVEDKWQIFEGRGWDKQNEDCHFSIDVAIIGNFTEEVPMENIFGPINYLKSEGIIEDHFNNECPVVLSENETKPTDSPGPYIYREMYKISEFFVSKNIIESFCDFHEISKLLYC